MTKPTLIAAELCVDDRGSITFSNGFDLAEAGVRRMYLTDNHKAGFVRAWHGHKKEAKFVMAVSGAAMVCTVEIVGQRYLAEKVEKFTLSAVSPKILYIPPGYANGWTSLTPDCRLLWLSTATMEETKKDDYRWNPREVDPWTVEER